MTLWGKHGNFSIYILKLKIFLQDFFQLFYLEPVSLDQDSTYINFLKDPQILK